MALQSITGGLWVPDPLISIASAVQFTTATTIDAGTELSAGIFFAPKAGAIRTIGFRTGAVTVDATTRLNVNLETVSATDGNPTGTDYGGSAVGTAGAAPTANSWNSIALGTDATVVNVGDIIAAVIGFGTFVAADTVVISGVNSGNSSAVDFPYCDSFVGGAWTKPTGILPCIAIGYSDGTYAYVPGLMPFSAITNQSYASNTAVTDEYALSFQMPVPCSLRGVAADVDGDGDFEVVLYTGTTATETIAVDKDQRQGTARRLRYFRFIQDRNLTANTTYRIGIKPTTTTAIVLSIFTVNAAAIWDQTAGGQIFRLGTRLDAGSWDSDTVTQRPSVYLQFSQFDDGVQSNATRLVGGVLAG